MAGGKQQAWSVPSPPLPLAKPLRTGIDSASATAWLIVPETDTLGARAVAQMGLAAIDLLQPEDWPVVAVHGLVCSMGYAHHSMLLRELEAPIPAPPPAAAR